MTRTMTAAYAALIFTLIIAAPSRAAAEQPRSTALAKQLVTLMAERQLESVAAPDPETPDRFIAAMAYPNVQLLVMAAKYPSPDYLRAQLEQRRYSDVYAALQQGVPESKLFFQDLGCDGLPTDKDQSPDIMYERGNVQTIFDGTGEKPKMSRDEYRQKLQEAEAQYSRLLTVLIGTLQGSPTTTSSITK
jgi:hypothetical protein